MIIFIIRQRVSSSHLSDSCHKKIWIRCITRTICIGNIRGSHLGAAASGTGNHFRSIGSGVSSIPGRWSRPNIGVNLVDLFHFHVNGVARITKDAGPKAIWHRNGQDNDEISGFIQPSQYLVHRLRIHFPREFVVGHEVDKYLSNVMGTGSKIVDQKESISPSGYTNDSLGSLFWITSIERSCTYTGKKV